MSPDRTSPSEAETERSSVTESERPSTTKKIVPAVMMPMPPSWTRTARSARPAGESAAPTPIGSSPVTQAAEVATKRRSIPRCQAPSALANGEASRSPPSAIAAAKARTRARGAETKA